MLEFPICGRESTGQASGLDKLTLTEAEELLLCNWKGRGLKEGLGPLNLILFAEVPVKDSWLPGKVG